MYVFYIFFFLTVYLDDDLCILPPWSMLAVLDDNLWSLPPVAMGLKPLLPRGMLLRSILTVLVGVGVVPGMMGPSCFCLFLGTDFSFRGSFLGVVIFIS